MNPGRAFQPVLITAIKRNAAFSICVLFVAANLCAQQPDTIRVPVRLVTAPVLVFSKQGKFIEGLQTSDFRLYDNGRPQTIKLDASAPALSVVLAIQVNQDVRQYLPFMAKVGSVIENLLLGEMGEAAIVTYDEEIATRKPFGSGDIASTMRKLALGGEKARMIDAGLRAVSMLAARSPSRDRILLFIGQPADNGSNGTLGNLKEQAERENVSIYALTLPEFGKSFVSDTFAVHGLDGGAAVSVELTKLIPALKRASKAAEHADPFSVLTSATGGIQLPFRKQRQLEDALTALGNDLRSGYLLGYSPRPAKPGYHHISISVDIPSAAVYSRPGYILPAQ